MSNGHNTPEPRLSQEARELIRNYLVKIGIPSGLTLTVLSFAFGFLFNDVVRKDAYMAAYEKAYERAMNSQSTVVSQSAARIAEAEVAVKASATAMNEAMTDVESRAKEATTEMNNALAIAEKIKAMESLTRTDAQITLIAKELAANSDFAARVVSTTIPVGTVAFFRTECQNSIGWHTYEPARGRYLVGLPSNGRVGAVVGSELSDRENRPAGQHQHESERFVLRRGTGDAVEWRSPGAVLQVAGTVPTDSGKGLKPGTNAPYIQLYVCERR